MISGITIVCREVDKNTGAVAAYICKKNVDDRDIHLASIRSRLNPELRYYAIRTCVADDVEALEDLLRFLKYRELTEADVSHYGGIVRL
nr:MAG TPA: hypothetical protein [Caudoviricetes sp.]